MRINFAVYVDCVKAKISRVETPESEGGEITLTYMRERVVGGVEGPLSVPYSRLDSLSVHEMKTFIMGVNRVLNEGNTAVHAQVNECADNDVFLVIVDKFLDILYKIFSRSFHNEEYADVLYDVDLVKKEEKAFVRFIREQLYCCAENDVLQNLHLHLQLMNL